MVYDRVDSDDESDHLDNQDLREWQARSGREVDHDGPIRLATEHDEPLPSSPPVNKRNHNATVAWKELPRKDQLFIITLARMSEPLVQSSLQV